jgi:hypothetical protein
MAFYKESNVFHSRARFLQAGGTGLASRNAVGRGLAVLSFSNRRHWRRPLCFFRLRGLFRDAM